MFEVLPGAGVEPGHDPDKFNGVVRSHSNEGSARLVDLSRAVGYPAGAVLGERRSQRKEKEGRAVVSEGFLLPKN